MTDINEILKNWQPMKDAFNDLEFNSYKTGPGAGLPAILHAKHQNSSANAAPATAPNPFLTMRNVPKRLNTHGLENLCRRYGNVHKIHYSEKCNMYFVYFYTVRDMEEAYNHLSKNEFGFEVYVGVKKKDNDLPLIDELTNALPLLPAESGPQFDRRRIPLSEKLPKRPYLKPIDLIIDDAHNLLPINDPLGFHLFVNDVFNLDYSGLAGDTKKFSLTGKYDYFAGRAFLQLTDVEKTLLKQTKPKEFAQAAGKKLFAEMNFGNCANCHLPCTWKCTTNQVFLCSNHCQKLIADMQQPEFPASGSRVCIMSINQANVVFIREKSAAADIAFLKLTSKVHSKSLKLTKLRLPPVTGQLVVSKFNNVFQRAIVLNAQNLQAIRIMCLDYGNILEKPITELYSAPTEFQQLPCLVRPVILKGLKEFYMTNNLRILLYAQLEKTTFKLRYDKNLDFEAEKNTYSVELIELASNDNLNQFIYRLSNAEPPTALEQAKSITESHMNMLPLKCGENIELMVMDTSWLNNGYLYCSHKAYVLEIQQFQKDIACYVTEAKDLVEYAPRPEELCLAKYSVDEQWYRGIGMETVGDGFPTIQFIDYGNVVAVPLKNIIRYPRQFQFPICTHLCKIDGLPSILTGQLIMRLEQLLQERESIICDQVLQEDDEHGMVYIIQITDIITQLENEGLFADPNSAID